MERLQHRLENSGAWQLVMVFAYGASAVWFLWDLFASSGPPSDVDALALIGSTFIIFDCAVRIGARILGRRSG